VARRPYSLLLIATLCPAAGLGAQTVWDAPLLLGPTTPAGVGFYISDPHGSEGLGVFAVWRPAATPGGVGLRAGVTEDFAGDIVLAGGADLTGPLASVAGPLPMDVIWIAGLGATASDVVVLSFPLGVSLGLRVDRESATLRPWISPRVVLDGYIGDGSRDEDVSVHTAIDVGVALAFHERWAVRFGATVGDRQAIALGVHVNPAVR
jgi:hypothetical protein